MVHEALARFHPVLAAWFAKSFGAPTDVQLRAWEAAASGVHTLIAAPTGSGKTLAALMPGLDSIAREKNGGAYSPGVRLLYVTPLKALNNDIQHHVAEFAAELDAVAAEADHAGNWRSIESAVRTGDTPQKERAAMVKRPPDVLVTTPESLYLLLLSERSRDILRKVTHVIVDEIHSLVPDKRGAHLSLSLERLARLCVGSGGAEPQRIGVSATQNPLSTAARFLAGYEAEGAERPVAIVESDMKKSYDIQVTVPDYTVPKQDREAVWQALTDRIKQLMGKARTVLIFVNNRRLCERLVLRLNDRFGEGFARAHHGSVSREKRLEAEQLLKEGKLRCLIATSSLELGIDIGHIDLVLQIDPPLSAASGIQRIGRAGHSVGDTSIGRIIVRHRGALPETAVISRLIREREIEPIRMAVAPIDVLAQQITAAVASETLEVAQLLTLIRQAAPFHSLQEERFFDVVNMLAGFFPFVRPLIDWNRSSGKLAARSNTRMAAVTGTGTIPSSANYPVYHADSNIPLGDLEEEFVHESNVGDVFQLGAHSWMIREIKRDRVIVSEAVNRYSEVPFWRGKFGGRSFELGERIGAFVRELIRRLNRRAEPEIIDWLASEYGLDAAAAKELINIIRRQEETSHMPTDRKIVVEQYEDVTGQIHIVVHNYWGQRVNRAWLMALEHVWEKTLANAPYANAKDNGIELVFRSREADALPAIWQLTPETAEAALAEKVPSSAMFAITFRRIAETALLLTRGFERIPAWQRRLRAEELMQAALPFAEEFPLFRAAVDECLRESLDAMHLRHVLQRLADGKIEVVTAASDVPSPLAIQFMHDYVSTMLYEGNAPSEELKRQLQQVSRKLAGKLFGDTSMEERIDPKVVAAEEKRLTSGGRAVRSADDLAVLLKQRGDLSREQLRKIAGKDADAWIQTLVQEGRIAQVVLGEEARFVPLDELPTYTRFPQDPTAARFVLLRFINGQIAFTAEDLAKRYGLPQESAAAFIEKWAQEGIIEPAPFAEPDSPYWSSRQVASRIVRLSLSAVRNASAPVEPERWMQLLAMRHGISGAGGDLRSALRPLQGLFLPASQWETAILPARVGAYRKEELDALCASGELFWLGRRFENEKEGRIAFFFADSEALLEGAQTLAPPADEPSAHPELLELLQKRGAIFLTRLSAETGEAPSALLPKLMELVWEGRVANDQFAPIRHFLLARGKLHPKLGSGQGRWYAVESPPSESDRIQEQAVTWAKQLLYAFGTVTKDIVNTYAPFGWDTALPLLKQLEEWGMVTRGLFIEGVPTLQFMEQETLTALRNVTAPQGVACLSAADPAVPYGIALPWPDVPGARFARKSNHYLVLVNGVWTYWIEANGKHVHRIRQPHDTDDTDDADVLLPVFRELLRRNHLKRIRIETWNALPAADAGIAPLLERGAERDQGSLVLWPSQLA